MNFEFAYLVTYFYVYWVKSLSFDLGNTCTLSTEVSVVSFSILVSWIVQGNLSIFYKLPETVAVLWLAVSRARCIFMGSYNWDFVDQYFRTLRTSLRTDFVSHSNCKTDYFLDPMCMHAIWVVRSWFLGERHGTLLFLFKICLET